MAAKRKATKRKANRSGGTHDYVNEFLARFPTKARRMVRPGMELRQGTVLSIQASEMHYCKPRKNNATKYTHVEVSTTSTILDLNPYAETPGSVYYPYVPVTLVNEIIAQRGGIQKVFAYNKG